MLHLLPDLQSLSDFPERSDVGEKSWAERNALGFDLDQCQSVSLPAGCSRTNVIVRFSMNGVMA